MTLRYGLVLICMMMWLYSCGQDHNNSADVLSDDKVEKSMEEWKAILDEKTFHVTREKGTEIAFTGKYNNHKENGTYLCSNCGNALFHSDHKFDSGSGWPSFYTTASKKNVAEVKDNSLGWNRIEVICNRCRAHLGHVFNDGPAPTGKRYCVNSASLNFSPKKSGNEEE